MIRFLCVQVACDILLKSSQWGLQFCLDLISIGGLYIKLWGPKNTGVLILTILGLPLGNLGTKNHLDVGLVERHTIYYKGEGGGFPQVRAVVSLVNPSLPMARHSTKSVTTLTLGSRPRQRLARLWAERKPGVTFHVPKNAREYERVNLHTPKATPTWGVGVSKDSRIFRERWHGSKPIGLKSSLNHCKFIEI